MVSGFDGGFEVRVKIMFDDFSMSKKLLSVVLDFVEEYLRVGQVKSIEILKISATNEYFNLFSCLRGLIHFLSKDIFN